MRCKRRLLVCKILYYSFIGRQLRPIILSAHYASQRQERQYQCRGCAALFSAFSFRINQKTEAQAAQRPLQHSSRYFCLIFIIFTSTHITWIKHHTWVYHEPNFPPSFLSEVLRIVIDIHRLSQPTYFPPGGPLIHSRVVAGLAFKRRSRSPCAVLSPYALCNHTESCSQVY